MGVSYSDSGISKTVQDINHY